MKSSLHNLSCASLAEATLKNTKRLVSSVCDAFAAMLPFLAASVVASGLIGLLVCGMVSCQALSDAAANPDQGAVVAGEAVQGVATALGVPVPVAAVLGTGVTILAAAVTFKMRKKKKPATP